MEKIGFIGLGIMGAPMAKHLLDAGFSLFVNSRSGLPQSLASYQLTVCDSAKQVAELANVIILMLPDTQMWKLYCLELMVCPKQVLPVR
jgi:2-hydroxy-3-oxopropionate reductase